MGEYAPDALRWLAGQIVARIPSAALSGIVGDDAHLSGYHRSRNRLRAAGRTGDYSIQLDADRRGDGDAASAIDIKLSASQMRVVTKRLLKSAKDAADPRLNYIREFYGTTDGVNVAGWDCYYGRSATSDSSHLWHVHISFLRKYSDDRAAAAAVLDVLLGNPYTGDNMAFTEADARTLLAYDPGDTDAGIENWKWRSDFETNKTVQFRFGVWLGPEEAHQARVAAEAGLAEIRAVRLGQEAILAALKGLDTKAVITRINEIASTEAQRDTDLLNLIQRGQTGDLDAKEVVRLMGERLLAGAGA